MKMVIGLDLLATMTLDWSAFSAAELAGGEARNKDAARSQKSPAKSAITTPLIAIVREITDEPNQSVIQLSGRARTVRNVEGIGAVNGANVVEAA